MRLLIACISIAAFLGSAEAQDVRSIERELQAMYVGKNLIMQQPYQASKIVFDMNGNVVGKPTPTCEADVPLHIDSLKLTKQNLILKGSRAPSHQVLMERSTGKPARRPPAPKVQHVEIRVLAGGHAWQIGDIKRAIDNIEKRVAAPIPNPPQATSPPPGSDRRVLYVIPEGPVYKAEDGVSAPRAISAPDAEYSEDARKAKICGSIELKAVVLQDGSTAYVRLGSPNIGHGLDRKSVEAVKKWRFTPGQLDGRPVNTEISVTSSFRLY